MLSHSHLLARSPLTLALLITLLLGTSVTVAIFAVSASSLRGPVSAAPEPGSQIQKRQSNLPASSRPGALFVHAQVASLCVNPGGTGGCFATIQAAVNAAANGDTINVEAGTYVEDVAIPVANLSLLGFGPGTKTISGAIGGSGSTVSIGASNVTVAGFTITREGNTPAQWNNAGLNSAGISIQGQSLTGALIRDNLIAVNRTGIDINNSNGHTIRNNIIDDNRTGIIFRNQTDQMTVVENFVTNNWTVGILFLDASGGSNVPVQSALHSTFGNNNLSGNWYGQIVDRQSGGTLPAPGTTNLKNFRGNWFGTTSPVVTTANSAEPGYAAQIPPSGGGTAMAPGGQPDIAGPASANFQYTPLLLSGTDTNIETTPGRGTFGFQGVQNKIIVTPANQNGWVFFDDFPGMGTGSGGFEAGPGTAPLGAGSAFLEVDANGRHAFATAGYGGTRMDDITGLSYYSYQTNNVTVANSLQFDMDWDLNDASNTFQGRLVFEPYLTPAQGTVQQNVWQSWDARAGNWYGTRTTVIVNNVAGVTQPCQPASPCTWAQVLALFPNGGVRNTTTSLMIFKAGGPWPPGFRGNVDDFRITVNTAQVTYDFEPLPQLSIDDVTHNEGNAGTTTYTFTVTLSFASAQTVTVDYATADSSATAPSDYAALATTQLIFNPGETTKPVTVFANGDTSFESNETFFVNLSNPNANAAIVDGQGIGTIANDETTLTLAPAVSPTALDNDYTRINNAIQSSFAGETIKLSGTFNWTEANAAASWALGSDGVAATGDDYEILVPANLNNVTLTADNLGDATIQGPGDLAGVNLEAVLVFDGGTNQNWTISNLRFLDFDLSIGMFAGAGGVSAHNNTNVSNNYIRIARDLNATVAPADVNQNIGIHFSFGTNQVISGNTIEIQGDAVSDSANSRFATDIGMQSNTSGGNVYEGLQITNNIIRVLNAQSADPQVVIGIWENAHGHTSNITVSGNQFINQAIGNNPAINLQRGFRVTSHSSATTTVTYSNNTVTGANIGFQWLAGSNFAGNQPVKLTSNTIANGGTGVLVQSQGLANLSFNRIVGNTVQGLNNVDGIVTAENNWWGCNAGPGNAGCDAVLNGSGSTDFNPWLVLGISAAPSTITLGGTSTVTADMTHNSDNLVPSATIFVPPTAVSFGATLGTMAPPAGTLSSGQAASTFTATSAGNGSASATVDNETVSTPITIDKANQTITVNTHAPANATYNSSFTVAATSSSGLAVVYSSAGVCTNVGATFTMTSGTGTCTVNYDQTGDTNYNAATQVSESVTAQKASQSIAVNTHAPANAAYNASFTVAATSNSGLAVVYSSSGVCTNVGATFTMTSGSGTCTVNYDQVGNTNYNAATQVTETVNAQKANQTITVNTHAPANATYNTSFTVAATSNSALAVAYSSSGVCTNVGATFTMTNGTGTCTVRYDQTGDTNFNAATQVTESVTAQKANQTITVNTHAPANATHNTSFTVAATSNSALAVAYSSSGVCTNVGATFTMTSGSGTCTVRYDQAGDTNFNAATQVTESVTAQKAAQTITFAALANKIFGDPDFTLSATSDSGLSVSFAATGNCSVTGSTDHITSTGSCTITASQAGNANFDAATNVARSFTIANSNQTITFAALANKTLGNPDFTVSATSDSNLAVSFAATGNCTVSGSLVHITAAGSCTITASQAGNSNYNAAADVPQSFMIANSALVTLSQSNYNVNENTGFVTITINRTGDLSVPVTVDYATDDTGSSNVCSTLNSGMASARCGFGFTLGTLRFAANETQKSFVIPIDQDSYTEGAETFTVNLSNLTGTGANLASPSSATVTISDSTAPAPNANDDTTAFVREHYHDFLNREPDASGLAFWINEIDSCGSNAGCREVKRIHVSAAFFLSIEFQQTGNLVRSFYVAALNRPATNNMPALTEFERDTQQMQRGVIVGQGNWQQALNDNRDAFMRDFVMRAEFVGLYPTTDSPGLYVSKLYQHAGITPAPGELDAAIAEFGSATTAADPGARGRALLDVTQNTTFQARETNRSFVQMQYLGYLRRNPNDAPDGDFAGYDFWVNKLNANGGNFITAEMVKAFLNSTEYRARFGP
jgi:hypothetical protein